MAETGTFVLEIGSEEIPSRFLPSEEKNCAQFFTEKLDELHLRHGTIAVYSTPRRLAVCIDELSLVQDEQEEVVAGPPKRIAYDANGAPTKALQGFMRTWGIGEDALFENETEKGVYISARRKTGGKSAAELLSTLCPSAIQAIPFAKRMRWGAYVVSYARPVHWIVALLDTEVVPFSFGPVESGRETFGHRIHGRGPFTLKSAKDYLSVVKNSCCVSLDPAERRRVIREEGDRLAVESGGLVLWKEGLLDEVVGLVEHPVPLLGHFDPAYLEVPKEVLLTSMEQHQKSFGIADQKGNLLPYFLTVSNTEPGDRDVVRKGWERVLHARLEDARFFWREDCKSSFDAWLDKLDAVIFIDRLGSMGDKTRRLESLCAFIAEKLVPGDREILSSARRAGRLSKADLVSGMVGEFDTLQGIMGGKYAEKMGENGLVADALKEQYLPAGPESPVPSTVTGAILSIADKADTLVGCFGLNRVPTGTADPFALRRCALGIIRITKAFSWHLPLDELFTKAQELYGEREWKVEKGEAVKRLVEFVGARLQKHLQTEGFSTVVTEACLRAGMHSVPDVYARVNALDHLTSRENYVALVQVMKRIANILQKRESADVASVDPALCTDPAEIALLKHLEGMDDLRSTDDYERILESLGTLQPVVDAFFNAVMVLCDDAALRRNRMALLASIQSIYDRVADFSALQI